MYSENTLCLYEAWWKICCSWGYTLPRAEVVTGYVVCGTAHLWWCWKAWNGTRYCCSRPFIGRDTILMHINNTDQSGHYIEYYMNYFCWHTYLKYWSSGTLHCCSHELFIGWDNILMHISSMHLVGQYIEYYMKYRWSATLYRDN